MTGRQRLRGTWLLIFVCAAVGAALYLVSVVGTDVVPLRNYYNIHAIVPTTVGLAPDADVEEDGVRIGEVITIGKGIGPSSVLNLQLDRAYGPVYGDATIVIRDKSIAQETYVALDPGHPSAGRLPSGSTLPITHDEQYVNIDQIFSIFDAPHRAALQHALAGLGPGLGNGENLNQTLGSMAALTEAASPFARIAAQDRGQLADLVDAFGQVTTALGQRRAAIETLTTQAATAATAVAARDQQLRDTLDLLPSFLAQSRLTATTLGDFSLNATPVVHNLRLATAELVPAIQDLGPAATEGRRAVAELDRFATVGLAPFRQLTPFSQSARAFAAPLEAFVRQLNPMLAYLDPYWREIGTWFANAGAVTAHSDQIGHVARVMLPISQSDLPATLPPQLEALLKKLAGPLDTRGSNPYPAPGTAGAPTPFSGQYPRIQADPAYAK